jgi:hypothetical protein
MARSEREKREDAYLPSGHEDAEEVAWLWRSSVARGEVATWAKEKG